VSPGRDGGAGGAEVRPHPDVHAAWGWSRGERAPGSAQRCGHTQVCCHCRALLAATLCLAPTPRQFNILFTTLGTMVMPIWIPHLGNVVVAFTLVIPRECVLTPAPPPPHTHTHMRARARDATCRHSLVLASAPCCVRLPTCSPSCQTHALFDCAACGRPCPHVTCSRPGGAVAVVRPVCGVAQHRLHDGAVRRRHGRHVLLRRAAQPGASGVLFQSCCRGTQSSHQVALCARAARHHMLGTRPDCHRCLLLCPPVHNAHTACGAAGYLCDRVCVGRQQLCADAAHGAHHGQHAERAAGVCGHPGHLGVGARVSRVLRGRGAAPGCCRWRRARRRVCLRDASL
jgi:hypothetical protein